MGLTSTIAAICVAVSFDVTNGQSNIGRGAVDSRHVSVSGISSGADMAVQLQVALSETFRGVGVFAGQAYHCAVYRFPRDTLSSTSNPSVPYCDGCPPGETLSYDHCKRHPEWTAAWPLADRARKFSAEGKIDPLTTLATRKAFLYRGKSDTTYLKGSVNVTKEFFIAAGMPSSAIRFETQIDSPHLVPGIDPYLCWWEEWSGPDNCTFDGAGAVLSWVHGDGALSAGRDNATESLFGRLSNFDQRPYHVQGSYLAPEGRIFVPVACVHEGANCRLHVFLHGCGVTPTFDVFSKYAGFNEWAMRNKFIVLYPRMGTSGPTPQLKSGCFDGYGQTGADYDQRTAPQIASILNMVKYFIEA